MTPTEQNQAEDPCAIMMWFMDLSSVNQFAAAANPHGWAVAQAQHLPEAEQAATIARLEARANVWCELLLNLPTEE